MKGKIIKIIASIMILAIAYSIWYLTPKQYTESVDGVYYQLGEEGITEHIKIKFDGKLKNHINGKKSFEGVIEFEGNEIPQIPEDRTDLELHYHGDNFSTIFSGFRIKDDLGRVESDFYNYGWIYINDDFTEFTIKVMDNNSWSESDGFMITAPAKDREEALKKSEAIIRNFEAD